LAEICFELGGGVAIILPESREELEWRRRRKRSKGEGGFPLCF